MEEKKYKAGETIIKQVSPLSVRSKAVRIGCLVALDSVQLLLVQGDEIDADSHVYFLISGTCKIHLNIDVSQNWSYFITEN